MAELQLKITGDNLAVSDGYHTFGELYEHRIALWITLCRFVATEAAPSWGRRDVWRAKCHSDGSSISGWFILGMGKDAGEQITYHLPMSRWVECDFAQTLLCAPEFDKHTSADVLARLGGL